MLKAGAAIAIVIVVVIAGTEYVLSISPPGIFVMWNVPPVGQQNGTYSYGTSAVFDSDHETYLRPQIDRVTVENSVLVDVGNPMVGDPALSIRVDPASHNVIASSASWTQRIALRFDASSATSYHLGTMRVRLRFDYDGWIVNRSGVETEQDYIVPVPYPAFGATHAQSMDSWYIDYQESTWSTFNGDTILWDAGTE